MVVEGFNKSSPNFKMKFRLNEETIKSVERSTGRTVEQIRYSPLNIDVNNIKYCRLGNSIYPRNVYLQQGRLVNEKEAKKYLDSIGRTSFSRLKQLLSNIFRKTI